MSGWYLQVDDSDESVQQGDVLTAFPIIQTYLEKSDIEDALNRKKIQPQAETLLSDVAVMSQSCDLANRKVTSVVLAPAIESKLWLSQIEGSSRRKSIESQVRKRQVNYVHVLPADPRLGVPERFIDFRMLYTTSLDTISAYLGVLSDRRFRLKDGPRAALGQRFGLFFSRVAEPDPPPHEPN